MSEYDYFMHDGLDNVIEELTNPYSESSLLANLQPQDPQSIIPIDVVTMLQGAAETQNIEFNLDNILSEDEEFAQGQIDSELGPVDEQSLQNSIPHYKKRRTQSRRSKLPKGYAMPDPLNQLMLKANTAYINGENAIALSTLREIIKERPELEQPWRTLAMIYTSTGDSNKALQCNTMAAHLSKDNSELWAMLGAQSFELGYNQQALYCLSKALKYDPNDTQARWNQALIFQQEGMIENAINSYKELWIQLPGDKDVLNELAQLSLQANLPSLGISYYEQVIALDLAGKVTELDAEFMDVDVVGAASMGVEITSGYRLVYEDIDLLCSLYISVGNYENGIRTVKNYIALLNGEPIPTLEDYDDDQDCYSVERHIPLPILGKLAVFRIMQGDWDNAGYHLTHILKSPNNAEILFEIGCAYLNQGHFRDALNIFEPMSENNEEAENIELWRNIADSAEGVGDINKAISASETILELLPTDRRYQDKLISLLESAGREEEAHKKLVEFTRIRQAEDFNDPKVVDYQDKPLVSFSFKKLGARRRVDSNKVARDHQESECKFVFERIQVFEVKGDFGREYCKLVRKLIDFLSDHSRDRPGLRNLIRMTLWLPNEFNNYRNDGKVLGIKTQTWYDTLIRYAQIMIRDSKEDEAYLVLHTILHRDILYADPRCRFEAYMTLLCAAVSFQNYKKVGQIVRNFCVEDEYLGDGCRLFLSSYRGFKFFDENVFTDSSLQKYWRRMVQKIEDGEFNLDANIQVYAMQGHFFLCSKMYHGALRSYLKALKLNPDNDVLNLCTAVAFVHRGLQKNYTRAGNFTKALLFLNKYRQVRGEVPEVFYNIGRLYQHIGICHMAIVFYRKVLEFGESPFKWPAGHNLAMIFVNAGSTELARQTLKDYCTFE